MAAAELRFKGYVTYSSRSRRAVAAPRVVLLVRQEITQNSLNYVDLSSEIAEYAAETLTVNGQNVHVVSCYIACGVPWEPWALVTIRSRARREALECGDFSAHQESWGRRQQ